MTFFVTFTKNAFFPSHKTSPMTNSTCVAVKNGYHQIDWVYTAFGECVRTPNERVAFAFGLLAIASWVVANLPQLYENYQKKSVKGLSKMMLFLWTSADSANLLGTVLLQSLATQVLIASYYIFSDIMLIFQYMYYQQMEKRTHNTGSPLAETLSFESTASDDLSSSTNYTSVDDSNGRTMLRSVLLLALFAAVCFIAFTAQQTTYHSNNNLYDLRLTKQMGRRLQSVSETFSEDIESERHQWPPRGVYKITGYVVGCISGLIYLVSRWPQVIHNFKRGTTTGMSPLLFTFTCMGNLTYTLSIFLYSTDRSYLLLQIPWLIGSLGVLCVDMFILIQVFWFEVIKKRIGSSRSTGLSTSYHKLSEEDIADDNL